MKIENAALLEDILSIVSQGGTYTDRQTGRTLTGVPFSDIATSLRGGLTGRYRPESRRVWKNVSRIDEIDLRKSGFNTLYGGNGDWVDQNGRTVAKWTTIIAL